MSGNGSLWLREPVKPSLSHWRTTVGLSLHGPYAAEYLEKCSRSACCGGYLPPGVWVLVILGGCIAAPWPPL